MSPHDRQRNLRRRAMSGVISPVFTRASMRRTSISALGNCMPFRRISSASTVQRGPFHPIDSPTCFYPPRNAGEGGIGRFFRHWGGEALYVCHENDPHTSPAISCIGTPCIVEAHVPIASLREHGNLECSIYRRYLFSRRGCIPQPSDYEDAIEHPLPAENVRRVIPFPDPDFYSLTDCSEWCRPIPHCPSGPCA